MIAAPVPVGSDQADYHSVFVVAAGSASERVRDTFGGRWAFNARGSHSGWNMPRAHLAGLGAHYAAEIGPFGPHQCAAAAVATGKADVAALDSLVWSLLIRHDPTLARQLRVVGRTPSQPAPPLVAARAAPPGGSGDVARLRDTLVALHGDAEGRALLADVCLVRFAAASHAGYAVTRTLEMA